MVNFRRYRNNNGGWYEEPTRHSLAAQGIKTGAKNVLGKIGSGIGKGARFLGSGISEMVHPDKEDVMQKSDIQEQAVMKDVDDIVTTAEVGDDDFDVEEPIFDDVSVVSEDDDVDDILTDPSEKATIKHDFRDKVRKELDELDDLIDSSDDGGFGDTMRGFFGNVLFDTDKGLRSNDVEGLNRQLVKMEAHKQMYKDKVRVVNQIRDDIVSKKFTDDVDVGDQFRNIEDVNRHIEELNVGLNKAELTSGKLRNQLRMVGRSKTVGVKRRMNDSKSNSLFPSFNDLFGFSSPDSKVELFAKGKGKWR